MQPTFNGEQLRARTFRSMGTVVSLTVASGTSAQTAVDELQSAVDVVGEIFTQLDLTFSLYREGSEASRLARGVCVGVNAGALRSGLGMARGHRRGVHG